MGEADLGWSIAGVCNMSRNSRCGLTGVREAGECAPSESCAARLFELFLLLTVVWLEFGLIVKAWASVFKDWTQQRQKWDRINVTCSFVWWLTFKISSPKHEEQTGKNQGRKVGNSFWIGGFLLFKLPMSVRVTERVRTGESRCKVLCKCLPKGQWCFSAETWLCGHVLNLHTDAELQRLSVTWRESSFRKKIKKNKRMYKEKCENDKNVKIIKVKSKCHPLELWWSQWDGKWSIILS